MAASSSTAAAFRIGCGVYDITGPAAQRSMMGYAHPFQQTAGIHMRLRSRAFVIASLDGSRRLAYVSADLCMITQAVKMAVVQDLRLRFGDLYATENVMLSATHTHSGPGGFSHYTLYNLSSLGFDHQNFQAIVRGISESIFRAHGNLTPGRIAMASGEVHGLSKNRSPKAYEQNPAAERARYDSNTDDSTTVLRFEAQDGTELGMLCWLAIHGTSLSNKNLLISGDNKGYASYLFEALKGADYGSSGPFVAAFAQSNEGDSSPNVYGEKDGRGPDQFSSLMASGRRQYEAAVALYASASAVLAPNLDYRHVHVDLSAAPIDAAWTGGAGAQSTCPAAIGASMLAGTEDGRGVGQEGLSNSRIRRFIFKLLLLPRRREVRQAWESLLNPRAGDDCQGEKPEVIPTGSFLPPWTPQVLPFQVATIGALAIVAVPFELTTMAGRRLKETVLRELAQAGVSRIVIAGLSNAYAGYVTTREEYDRQDYEGASTHFGPWTLAAVQQTCAGLARAVASGTGVQPGPDPVDMSAGLIDVQAGVLFDAAPPGRRFGGTLRDSRSSYAAGDKVSVSFWGGHPKNGLRIQSSFLEVERSDGGTWQPVARDWDPETRFAWKRWPLFLLPFSIVSVEWHIPPDTPPGTYRIKVYGDRKRPFGAIQPYSGTSSEFRIGAQ